ncbi:MAG: archease, partial [Methanobacteriota archaeon]
RALRGPARGGRDPLTRDPLTDAPRGFEILEHTADVGVRAWGPSLDEAFAEGARGLFSVIGRIDRVVPKGEIVVEVHGATLEELLYNFLDELLFAHSAEAVLFSEFEAKIDPQGPRVRAIARGEPLSIARHGPLSEVKAVTWHALEVHRGPGAEVRFFLDL